MFRDNFLIKKNLIYEIIIVFLTMQKPKWKQRKERTNQTFICKNYTRIDGTTNFLCNL